MSDQGRADTHHARKRAREVLAEMGVTRAPVPVERVIKKLNILLRHEALDEELSGMAYIDDGIAMIGVNALHSPNRQRFSAAHELAHHVLHSAEITGVVHVDKASKRVLMRDGVSSLGVDPLEIEANAFASELLMPTDLLMAELAGVPLDIEDENQMELLAKKFRVSTQAMSVRLAGLLGDPHTA